MSTFLNSFGRFDTTFEKKIGKRSFEVLEGSGAIFFDTEGDSFEQESSWQAKLSDMVVSAVVGLRIHKIAPAIFPAGVAAESAIRSQKRSMSQNIHALRKALFPEVKSEVARPKAYLYRTQEGFFVVLSLRGGLPPFNRHMKSQDDSGSLEISKEDCGSITLSPEAMEQLRRQARPMTDSGSEEGLDGVAPFVCFAGKWNTQHGDNESSVDWEELILKGRAQKCATFELVPVSTTWIPQWENAGLRGFRFTHPDCDLTISVQESNAQSLQSEQERLKREIEELKSILVFLQEFQRAEANFFFDRNSPTLNSGEIDWEKVEAWGSLVSRIPLHHLRSQYPNLVDRIVTCKKTTTAASLEELRNEFENFFSTLHVDAGFPIESPLAREFRGAELEFRQLKEDKVTDVDGTIDRWFVLLKNVRRDAGETSKLKVLIDLAIEYSKNRGDKTALMQRYEEFFRVYRSRICTKGVFPATIREKIARREKELIRLQMLSLCEQGTKNFSVETVLKEGEKFNSAVLQEWMEILSSIAFWTFPIVRTF